MGSPTAFVLAALVYFQKKAGQKCRVPGGLGRLIQPGNGQVCLTWWEPVEARECNSATCDNARTAIKHIFLASSVNSSIVCLTPLHRLQELFITWFHESVFLCYYVNLPGHPNVAEKLTACDDCVQESRNMTWELAGLHSPGKNLYKWLNEAVMHISSFIQVVQVTWWGGDNSTR